MSRAPLLRTAVLGVAFSLGVAGLASTIASASPPTADQRAPDSASMTYGAARLTEGLNGVLVYFAQALPPGPKEGALLVIDSNGAVTRYPVVIGPRRKTLPTDAPLVNGAQAAAAHSLISQPATQMIPPQEWVGKLAIIEIPAAPGTNAASLSAQKPHYRLCSRPASNGQGSQTVLRVDAPAPWEAAFHALGSDGTLASCP